MRGCGGGYAGMWRWLCGDVKVVMRGCGGGYAGIWRWLCGDVEVVMRRRAELIGKGDPPISRLGAVDYM